MAVAVKPNDSNTVFIGGGWGLEKLYFDGDEWQYISPVLPEDYPDYGCRSVLDIDFDPQKDIYFVAAARFEDLGEDSEGAAIINLKYDKEAIKTLLLAKAEEEQQELLEEDYNGVTLFSWKEGAKDMVISFSNAFKSFGTTFPILLGVILRSFSV